MSASKVAKLGIKKEKGFLYYLDTNGDVYRVKVESAGRDKATPEFVVKSGVQKVEGFLYFVDGDGDVSRTPDPE